MADSFYISGGSVRFAASGVTSGSSELGKFEGMFSLNVDTTISTRFGQAMVESDPMLIQMSGSVTIQQLSFDPDTYFDLFGITTTVSTIKSTAAETATKWQFKPSTIDIDLTKQYLLTGTRADNAKTFQLYIAAGGMPGIPGLPFGAGERAEMDVTIPCYLDSTSNWFEFIEED